MSSVTNRTDNARYVRLRLRTDAPVESQYLLVLASGMQFKVIDHYAGAVTPQARRKAGDVAAHTRNIEKGSEKTRKSV